MKILIDNGHGSDPPGKRSPDGKWHTATGWSAYTSRGNIAADALATCLYQSAARHLPGHRLRTDYTDGDPDIESGFYILRHTLCKAVLTENGFMDSHESLAYITSEAGKDAIVRLFVPHLGHGIGILILNIRCLKFCPAARAAEPSLTS